MKNSGRVSVAPPGEFSGRTLLLELFLLVATRRNHATKIPDGRVPRLVNQIE
jgi:hypothetical protein